MLCYTVLLLFCSFPSIWGVIETPEVLVVTVATEETDGLKRLLESATTYDIPVKVFGLGKEWKGGDTRIEQGGGQKINILKEGLKEYKDNKNMLIMFVDAYDVVFTAPLSTIIYRFFDQYADYRILFGAEPYCWPDQSLAVEYPLVEFGKRYLNSGLYTGYASDVYKMLTWKEVKDNDDDQLYFTMIYLDEKLRKELKITLDSMSRIFQNLNGVVDDVELQFNEEGEAVAYNAAYNTHPVIIHGNGPTKLHLNYLANYLGNKWNSRTGCGNCGDKSHLDMKELPTDQYPHVALAIFIAKPIPFVQEALDRIAKLDYPKGKISLFIYNSQPISRKNVLDFAEKYSAEYHTKKILNGGSEMTEREARQQAVAFLNRVDAQYLFQVDADVYFTNDQTLKLLLEYSVNYDTDIVAPLVGQPNKLYTNFWGAIAQNGYYARSEDYLAIIQGKRVGYFNVPFVTGAVLMAKETLDKMKDPYNYNKDFDADMSFCAYARDHGHFIHVNNEVYYGYLIVADDFVDNLKEGYLHTEMWEMFANPQLWESRYVHPKYKEALEGEEVDQACPDVYDYPLMSERYCEEMIEEMEHYGKWSSGTNDDKRLAGGYENVPTRDIHMNQIGYERQWLHFLNEYVRPMQEKVFVGYFQNPVYANMMFVVRYRPDEQAALRPHHDASTYSVDIALNKKNRDYEGGGVRYVRYNCTVPADEVGYTMMFPGRLTHMHEGLPTTSGTRYILVSFINP